jgi:hypothetical protein
MSGVDWGEVAAVARGRVAAAAREYRRTGLAAAVAALVVLPFSLPVGVALGLLALLFYFVVVRRSTAADPQVFIGRVVGRSLWRKVVDANEGAPNAGKRSEAAHFAKWLLTVRVDARVDLGSAAQPLYPVEARDVDFAVPRELFTRLGDGETVGMVVSPANDLLGFAATGPGVVWLDEPVDQAWKRGGYTVLEDPGAWPE